MKIGIVANIEKKAVKRVVPEVLEWLTHRGVDFMVDVALIERLQLRQESVNTFESDAFPQNCDMVLAFGGDGTILSTARLIGDAGTPILGVKVGGMGFLAELAPEELFTLLERIIAGQYDVFERLVLQGDVEADGAPKRFFALNDFVLEKGAASRIIRVNTFIDDEYLNSYIGDGIIVSSPTGSTAYSLAAGGPILLPSMDAIIINPICPHSLGARPVVIAGDMSVKIEVESASSQAMFSADGQVTFELKPGRSATIRKADHNIKLVSSGNLSFYDRLRTKLNWGEDIRK